MSNEDNSDIPRHSEHESGAEVKVQPREDGGVTVSFSDGSDDLEVSRREFMRISGVAAASAAMAGANCRYPQERVVPYLDRPDESEPGDTTEYATICNGCSAQCGVVVQTRSGRPIKLEGNEDHPVNEGSLCARGESSYRRLYDPDRATGPLKVRQDGTHAEIDWDELDTSVVNRLADGGSVRILTRNKPGSAREALLDEITDKLNDAEHYTWEPLASESVEQAAELSYGNRGMPTYHFERADMIVSLGSDFLGTWISPVEFTKKFSSNRTPEEGMSRFITIEGAMTLTGSNADEHHTVRTSHLVYVALGLTHQVIIEHEHGQMAGNSQLEQLLEDFSPEQVAQVTGLEADAIRSYADELVEHAGNGLVIGGGHASNAPNGVSLEAAVNLLNAALGNEGETIDRTAPSRQDEGNFEDLRKLTDEMKNGDVDVLIVDDVNPVYAAPPDLGFEDALQNVSLFVSTGDRVDETTKFADYLAAGNHYLESWGDSNPRHGVYALQQPAIQPLHDTRAFEESLLVWFGRSKVADLEPFLEAPEMPADKQTPEDAPNKQMGTNVPYDPGAWYRYVRTHWRTHVYTKADAAVDFDRFWEDVLRNGVIEIDDALAADNAFQIGATVDALPDELPDESASTDGGDLGDMELQTVATVGLYDGRTANNGHLQEMPDPVSKATWGSYALLSPRTFVAADLERGDVVSIEVDGPNGSSTSLEFPAMMQPGMHDDVVAVPLGYGRTEAGTVGSDLGENAFELTRTTDGVHALAGLSASVEPTGESDEIAVAQGSQIIDLEQRDILGTASLEAYEQDPAAGVESHTPDEMLWDAHDYETKWGMSIDLTKCTGCSACLTACQEENNIPVVGKQGVLEGREMHWMRIDRYFILPRPEDDEDFDDARGEFYDDPMLDEIPYEEFARRDPDAMSDLRAVNQPMLCQHCERAPCETVCPVSATTHSEDGLNQMTYNRCVGTRYCSNNCPFKVRRFNWYNYSRDRGDGIMARISPELEEHGRLNAEEPLPMGLNPDVTVRSRGVMEKCTFCVQRIRRAKWQMQEEGREEYLEDDVVTACEQACPADAINFGNIGKGSDHQVRKDHDSERAVSPLATLNVESSIAYLTDIRNTEMKPSEKGGHGGGHGSGGHGGDGHGDGHGQNGHGGGESGHGNDSQGGGESSHGGNEHGEQH